MPLVWYVSRAEAPASGRRPPYQERPQLAYGIPNDLVWTVALGEDFALSGSYDLSIEVRWHSEPFFAVVLVIDLGLFEGLGSKDGRAGCGSYWGTYWSNILYWI